MLSVKYLERSRQVAAGGRHVVFCVWISRRHTERQRGRGMWPSWPYHGKYLQFSQQGKEGNLSTTQSWSEASLSRWPHRRLWRSWWTVRWSVRRGRWRTLPASLPGWSASFSTLEWGTRTSESCSTSGSWPQGWWTPRQTNWTSIGRFCLSYRPDTSMTISSNSPAYTSQTFITSSLRSSG